MYTIGRLARRAKVNADSIRFYERQGLLSPATKTDSGYRLYTDDAVRRIAFIKHAQRCGFSLAEIGELLQMHNGDSTARSDGYRLAAEKQAEIRNTMEALQSMSDALSCLLAARTEAGSAAHIQLDQNPLLSALEANVTHDDARSGPQSRPLTLNRDEQRVFA